MTHACETAACLWKELNFKSLGYLMRLGAKLRDALAKQDTWQLHALRVHGPERYIETLRPQTLKP